LRRKALAASKESKLGELPLAEVISIAQGFARGINKEARPRLRIVGAGDPKDLHLVATNYRVIEANADHILVEIGSQPVVHWKKREDDVERDSVVDPPSAEFVQSLGAKIDAALIAKHNSGLQGGNRSEEWSAALVEELSQGLSRIARGVRFKDGKTEEAVWVQVDFGDGVVDFHPPSMQGGNWLQLSTKKAFPVFSDVKVFEESSGEE
jgi:hypothetical protein